MGKDTHVHLFMQKKLKPITRVHTNYVGSAGDKAFLSRVCECGAEKAVDYGKTTDLTEKYADDLEAELRKAIEG